MSEEGAEVQEATRALDEEKVVQEATRLETGINAILKELPEFQKPDLRALFFNEGQLPPGGMAAPAFERNGWYWRAEKGSESPTTLHLERSRQPFKWLEQNADHEKYEITEEQPGYSSDRPPIRRARLGAQTPDLFEPVGEKRTPLPVQNDVRALKALDEVLSDLRGPQTPENPQ